MSTQRRMTPLQRVSSTTLPWTMKSPSNDAGITRTERFCRVGWRLTAWLFSSWIIRLATNSLRSISCRLWGNDRNYRAITWEDALGLGHTRVGFAGAFFTAGLIATFFAPQLSFTSPSLSSASEHEHRISGPYGRVFMALAWTVQSASPQVPSGNSSGTERQHGQGNLYFKHAA